MKPLRVALLFGVAIYAATSGFASVPAEVARDLSQLQITRTFTRVKDLPIDLRRKLAAGFQQPRLQLADPGARYNEMSDFTYSGDPNVGLPARRLLLAFETAEHYFVYYEMGHPWHAAALVFHKAPLKLAWAGADVTMPPYAKSPTQLRHRILHHDLSDEEFFW